MTFLDYVLEMHRKECNDILEADDPQRHYSLRIDFLKMFERHPDIGDSVLCSPVTTLPACDQHLITAQQTLLAELQPVLSRAGPASVQSEEEGTRRLTVKRNVHARFSSLPVCPELHRTIFPKNADVGCFLQVTGTVVRATQAKMLEHRRLYVCVKCKAECGVDARYEERYVLRPPTRCSAAGCRSSTFTPLALVGRELCRDYQELKIQEQVNKLSIGSIPGALWVTVEDDLVDCCKPGDDINVCGVLRRRWRPPASGRRCEVELVLHANHVTVCNALRTRAAAAAPDVAACFRDYWSDFSSFPLKGRDAILASVCPQVYGLHLVKLALLLTVVTGSQPAIGEEFGEEDRHRMTVRGQCHLLLVGDPGTGKSQLLRAGAELTPRSVFTCGAGSSRAGLTCAALREEGEWVLEAGALVLADGGVCCIDEVGQLREHDRAGVHEAMEQQTISIAKAGIVCKLNTRCAVIGACNPKGHYQAEQPLSANVSLGTPLLSRFDLIFILLDSKNEKWDELVSSYILFGGSPGPAPSGREPWCVDKLQLYMSVVGGLRAEMSESAHAVLRTYYMLQRGAELRDPSRTTVRMLDSLVRLSQAHCRLMYRERVLPVDAVAAVSLVDASMQTCILHDAGAALHSVPSAHPDLHYLRTARALLLRLALPRVWDEELLRYARLLGVDRGTLERELDEGSHKLFARFDDVAQDGVQLPNSVVTSSYFPMKTKEITDESSAERQTKKEHVNEKAVDINFKLAATLKKHSSLNKVLSEPILKEKNQGACKKRKLRQVSINDKCLNDRKPDKSRKNKDMIGKKGRSKNKNCNDSSEEIIDSVNILNHVPSVNDIFVDFDFHMVTSEEKDLESEELADHKRDQVKTSSKEEAPDLNVTKVNLTETVERKYFEKDRVITENNSTECSDINTSLRENKLLQYKYVQTRGLNNFFELPKSLNSAMPIEDNKTKCSTVKCSQGNSEASSQISMFETSDCDIDLEL